MLEHIHHYLAKTLVITPYFRKVFKTRTRDRAGPWLYHSLGLSRKLCFSAKPKVSLSIHGLPLYPTLREHATKHSKIFLFSKDGIVVS